MKYSAGISILIVAIAVFLLSQIAFADTVNDVTPSTTGSNTISDTPSTSPSAMVTIIATPKAIPTDIPNPSVSTPSASLGPTITPNPTIMQMRNDINNQVKKETNAINEFVKAAISSFFTSEVQSFRNFLQGLFK